MPIPAVVPPHDISRAERRRQFRRDFLEGFATLVAGFRYLRKRPALWHYALLPIAINILITLVIFAGLLVGTWYFLMWMHTWTYFAAGWWGRAQEALAIIVTIIAAFALAAGTYLLLQGILVSYFNERLAMRVELDLGTPASLLTDVPFKYQVLDGIADFLVITLTAAGCILLGCIPVLGTIVGGAVNLYVDCFVFGYDYFEIPLALRGQRRADKRACAKRHRGHVLGLGASVLLMNLIPIVGSIFLTTAAAGAVLLHRKMGLSIVDERAIAPRPAT